MENLLETIDFGDESGDTAESSELAAYFVEQSMFKKFVDPKHKILIATAKKGVGKSALIQWLAYRLGLDNKEAIVIKCRGADLTRGQFGLTTDLLTPNEYIRDWMVRICTTVNRRLAQDINFAWSDDRMALIEAAEIDGYKSRNLVGCLADRLAKFIPLGEPKKIGITNQLEVLRRAQNGNVSVWILIDDLDATFQSTENELLNLSTFFSACRYLAADLKDIHFRVTMRTDIWPVIRRYDEALDKVEQYVTSIVWDADDFRQLLAKRIEAQISKVGTNKKRQYAHIQDAELDLINQVFVERMQWGSNSDDDDNLEAAPIRTVHSHKIIYTLSYGRPRWAIQLCKAAQKDAIRLRNDRIGRNNIDNVWGYYGSKRIDDLVAEHKHQCKEINELINSFRGASRLMHKNELMVWINNRVLTHLKPRIDGRQTGSPVDVAQFLFKIGFLQARSDEKSGNYEHYGFDQMPDFLTSRTNDDFGVQWEIHPCYRNALDIKQINKSQRIKMGLIRPKNPSR
jgi:hypothetical protein